MILPGTSAHLNQQDMSPENRIKVLYLAGWGRSGTTLLSNILGEVDGFFSPGEIWNLWQRGLVDNRICGCGKPFLDCEFWSTVLEKAFGDLSQLDINRVLAEKDKLRNLEILMSMLPGGKQHLDTKLQGFLPYIRHLYEAIQQVSDCRVIVDASKIPINAYLLANLPNVELYILHIVRNPHAVAYSWMTTTHYDPLKSMYMDRFSPVHSTLIWSARNLLVQMLWGASKHYLLLRYEDFIKEPQATLTNIIQFCEEEPADLPFITEDMVELGLNHNVSGNPNRFNTGQVKLSLDSRWETQMNWKDKTLVNAMFLPLVARYGYLGNNSKQR